MKETLIFWTSIQAMGLAAFPLTFPFFRPLPDRGYAFTKVLGLLLVSYALWIGATLGILPNSRGSIILLLLVLALLSLGTAVRWRRELAAFLHRGWPYLLLVEALFLSVFALAVFLRSFAPQIIWGEKPFELAFLNSIHRADSFPPNDPWLAGESINYYYFGYVMASTLTKLSGLATSATFYLMLSLLAALSATAIFGLVYNLVMKASQRSNEPEEAPALNRSPERSEGKGEGDTPAQEGLIQPRAILFGLAAIGFLLLLSNLAGPFELLARHGVGPVEQADGQAGFYKAVGIFNLNGSYNCQAAPADCAAWYPTRFWWWWKATRIGSPFDIQEFPFFSFQFGDLHPHVLATPFTIALAAVAFTLLLAHRQQPLDWAWWRHYPGRLILLGLLIGGLIFIDAWTLPAVILLLAITALAANYLRHGLSSLRPLWDSLGFLLPLLAAAFLFYLPYHLNVEGGPFLTATSTVADALSLPSDIDKEGPLGGLRLLEAAANDFPPPNSEVTRPLHFLIFWGPLFWVPLSFAALYLRSALPRPPLALPVGRQRLLAAALSVAPVALWALLVSARQGIGFFADELAERGPQLLTLALLLAFATAALLAALREADRLQGTPSSHRPSEAGSFSSLFAFLLMALAFLLLLGGELYFVKDLLGWRANTVFRFWYQTWLLMAIAGGFGLYYLTRHWSLPRPALDQRLLPYGAASGVVLGLLYTLTVALEPFHVLWKDWWSATLGLIIAFLSVLVYAVASALQPTSFPLPLGEGKACPEPSRRGEGRARISLRLAWLAFTVLLLAAGLVYPVAVTFERTDGFRAQRSLNGLIHVQREDPAEYAAISWLNANFKDSPVILEAPGDDYSDAGRISARTGLPTVIGWVGHQLQWRGFPSADTLSPRETPFTARLAEVDRIYTTTDIAEAQRVMVKYDVKLVYVGRLERQRYLEQAPPQDQTLREAALAKFARFMQVVFRQGDVTIYHWSRPGAIVQQP